MSRELEPGRLYRMPVHFGPSPGPRERPEGGRLDPDVAREALRVSVSFRTQAQALTSILPPGFALDGEPVARLEASYMRGTPGSPDGATTRSESPSPRSGKARRRPPAIWSRSCSRTLCRSDHHRP